VFKDFYGWIQLGIFIILLICLTKPFGIYLMKVLDPSGRTFLDPILKPVEKFIYKASGINPQKAQTWKEYLFSLLMFSLIGFTMTFVILIFQRFLHSTRKSFQGSAGIWHSIRRRASPRIPTGRAMRVRRRCHIFQDGGAHLP
jgi:K+-transporting ATPase A subunit